MDPEATAVLHALCLGGGAGEPRVFSTAALIPSLCQAFRLDGTGFQDVYNRRLEDLLRPLTGQLSPLVVVAGLGSSILTPERLYQLHHVVLSETVTFQLRRDLEVLGEPLDWHGREVRIQSQGETPATGILRLLQRDHFRHAEFLLWRKRLPPLRVVWNFPELELYASPARCPGGWSLGPHNAMPCWIDSLGYALSMEALPLRLPFATLTQPAVASAVQGRCRLEQLCALPALASFSPDLLLLLTLYSCCDTQTWTGRVIRHLPTLSQQREVGLDASCPYYGRMQAYQQALRDALVRHPPVSDRLVQRLRELLPPQQPRPFLRAHAVPDGHPMERLRSFWGQYHWLSPYAAATAPEGFELSLRAFLTSAEVRRLDQLGPALVVLLLRPLSYEALEAALQSVE